MWGRITLVMCLVGCGRLGFDDQVAPIGNPTPDSGVALGPGPSGVGLVAAWDFENLDSTGSMSIVSPDLAVCDVTGCPAKATGVLGAGAAFDGVGSCLHVPSLASWTSPVLTLSAWLNVPDSMVSSIVPVVTRDPDGCASPGIQTDTAQVGFLFMGQDSVHYHAWTGGLTGNTWHQLGVRWDGVNEEVFIDGVCACGKPQMQQILFAVNEFTIGCDTYANVHTNGQIDEVRIYDRALTDLEMAQLTEIGGRIAPTPQSCAAACTITTDGP